MPITRKPKPPIKPFFFLPVLLLIIAGALVLSADVEEINGIKVPPSPDKIANRATIAGVDYNNNGIRDDIERLIVREFGTDPELYTLAKIFAIKEQAMLVQPSAATINEYLIVISCTNFPADKADVLTQALLNTEERRAIYGASMEDAVFGGCP